MIESLGGREIYENFLNKKLPPCTVNTIIYSWSDPTKQLDDDFQGEGFFTNSLSSKDFIEAYQTEKMQQLKVMDAQDVH
jgi:hypothetical protein